MTDLQEGLPKEPITPQKTPIEGMPPVDNVLPETPTNIQDLMVPPATPDLFSESATQDVINPVTTDAETPRSHRGRKIAIVAGSVAAAGALAAGAWFGLKGSGTPAPSNTPAASAPATPGPTATPEATTPPVAASPFSGELATTPDKISEYASPNFTLDQFKALSPSERTAFFIDKARDPGPKGLAAYAELYVYVSGNSLDTLPATISVDNTPQEIMRITTYGQRFALQFDQATAEKMLAGARPDLTAQSYYGVDNILKAQAPASARDLGAAAKEGQGILEGTFVSASDKKQDANNTTYIDIVNKGSEGTVSSRCYYITNGTLGMWEFSASSPIN